MVSCTVRRSQPLGLGSTEVTADSDTVLGSQDEGGITNTPTAQTAAHLLIKQLMVLIWFGNCEHSLACAGMFTACCHMFPADDTSYLSTCIPIKSAQLQDINCNAVSCV